MLKNVHKVERVQELKGLSQLHEQLLPLVFPQGTEVGQVGGRQAVHEEVYTLAESLTHLHKGKNRNTVRGGGMA
jgi:hypothetical protein